MKKYLSVVFLFAISVFNLQAQECTGMVTEGDSANTPVYQANVKVLQDEQLIIDGKTYFDGRFKFKVVPNQKYSVIVSIIGFRDSILKIKTDNSGTPFPNKFTIALRKEGLRLEGYIMGKENDNAIKDAGIILKNVMTRKEEKIITSFNGYYNFELDYETNYLVRIDKRSEGIMNTYEDTSFYISTIGFDKPLDFKLNIKLVPSREFVKARAEYDPKQMPQNKNVKPALEVYGTKDSVKILQQASVIAGLNRELFLKDSIISALDKKINDINKKEAVLELTSNEAKRDIQLKKKKEEEEKINQVKLDASKIEAQKKEGELNSKNAKEKRELEQARNSEIDLEKQILINRSILEKSKADSLKAKTTEKSVSVEKLKHENRVSQKLMEEKEKQNEKELVLKTKEEEKTRRLLQEQALNKAKIAAKELEKKTKEDAVTAKKYSKKDKKMKGGEVLFLPQDSFLTDQQIRDKQQRVYLEERKKKEQFDKAGLVQRIENFQKQQLEEKQVQEEYENSQKDLMESYERKLRGEKEPSENIQIEQDIQTSIKSSQTNIPSKIKVKGVVYDAVSSLPLNFVSLTIRMLNSILSQEVKSDEKGNYTFEVDSGYFYLVSYYKPGFILGKQLLDVTVQKDNSFKMADFSIKETDDFNISEKMPTVSFAKNSSTVPLDLLNEAIPIIKMMKEIPQLKIKIYGIASYDEAYPMELSISRAREVANLFMKNKVAEKRIKYNGYGSTKTKSGCVAGSGCEELQLSRDRIVLYKVVKD